MQVVGVKFRENGKIVYFDPEKKIYKKGDNVIAETTLGVQFGEVVIPNSEVEEENLELPLNPIIRFAGYKDREKLKQNREKALNAFSIADELIKKHNLDMKLLEAEYTFDGQKILFTFSSEDRVDFRDLVKDLANIFKVRIELKQIGIRDEVKLLGGLGPCGRETCCSRFLTDFTKVGIKMAKQQNLSLSPTKINGLCGKIMCCLAYENETYVENSELMPKINSMVKTPDGEGKVVYNNILSKIVSVKFEDEENPINTQIKEYPLDEIEKND